MRRSAIAEKIKTIVWDKVNQCFFQAVFVCHNDTLKFYNVTLNFESQDVVLP